MSDKESMKHFASLFFLFLITNFFCKGSTTGTIQIFESQADGLIRNSTAYCFVDVVPYVNGGVTFNYPPGFFSIAPAITADLQENGITYSTSQVFVAEITANSSTSTTIRVNLVTTSTITEANDNDVIIHFCAAGP